MMVEIYGWSRVKRKIITAEMIDKFYLKFHIEVCSVLSNTPNISDKQNGH